MKRIVYKRSTLSYDQDIQNNKPYDYRNINIMLVLPAKDIIA